MYICVYVYMCICIYVYMYICMYVCIYVSMYLCISVAILALAILIKLGCSKCWVCCHDVRIEIVATAFARRGANTT